MVWCDQLPSGVVFVRLRAMAPTIPIRVCGICLADPGQGDVKTRGHSLRSLVRSAGTLITNVAKITHQRISGR